MTVSGIRNTMQQNQPPAAATLQNALSCRSHTEPATDITKHPEGWEVAHTAASQTPTPPKQQADLEAKTVILGTINTRKTWEAEIKTTSDFITLCVWLPNKPG